MSPEDLQQFDSLLAKEESETTRQLEEIADKNPAVKGDYEVRVPEYGTDETENANEVTDLERNFAMEKELENRLNQIKKARGKIVDGTYGTCENCGKSIPEERLRAMPTAGFCMECADK